eukprot:gene10882-12678_t
MEDYLNGLKVVQLKAIIASHDEHVNAKLPRSKHMIIKYIIDNNLEPEMNELEEESEEEEIEEAPVVVVQETKPKIVRKSVVVVTKAMLAKQRQVPVEVSEEPTYDKATLEKMTVVNLKAKFLKGNNDPAIPRLKAQLIDYILNVVLKQSPDTDVESDQEEEEEEEEDVDESGESESDQEDVEMDGDKEHPEDSESEQDNSDSDTEDDEIIVSNIPISSEESIPVPMKTLETNPMPLESVMETSVEQPVVEQSVDKEQEKEETTNVVDEQVNTSVNIEESIPVPMETPPQEEVVAAVVEAVEETKIVEQSVEKKVEEKTTTISSRPVVAVVTQQQDKETLKYYSGSLNTAMDLDVAGTTNIGLLPVVLQNRIIVHCLLLDSATDQRYVSLAAWKYDVALVCRRWFDVVSNTLSHVTVSSANAMALNRIVEGRANRYSIVKRLRSLAATGDLLGKIANLALHVDSDAESDDHSWEEDADPYSSDEEDVTRKRTNVSVEIPEDLDHDDIEDDSAEDSEELEEYLEQYHHEHQDKYKGERGFKIASHYLAENDIVSSVESLQLDTPSTSLLSVLLSSNKFSNVTSLLLKTDDGPGLDLIGDSIALNKTITSYDFEFLRSAEDAPSADDNIDKILQVIATQKHDMLMRLRLISEHPGLRLSHLTSLLASKSLTSLEIDHCAEFKPATAEQITKALAPLQGNTTLRSLSLGSISPSLETMRMIANELPSVLANNRTLTKLSIGAELATPVLFEKTLPSMPMLSHLSAPASKPLFDYIRSNPENLRHLELQIVLSSHAAPIREALSGNHHLLSLSIADLPAVQSSKNNSNNNPAKEDILLSLFQGLQINDTVQELRLPKSIDNIINGISNLELTPRVEAIQSAQIAPGPSSINLGIVLLINAVKEAYEDFRRYQSDKRINGQIVQIIRNGSTIDVFWKDLVVGDIVCVKNEEQFPADMVLLSSSSDASPGLCYIETSNLDGETNLKTKQSLMETNHLQTPQDYIGLSAFVECEAPSHILNKFDGRITIGTEQYPLNAEQLLIRGTQLMNTKCIYGMVVYTGHETKYMLNTMATPTKRSKLEKSMNKILIYVLIAEGLLCLASALVGLGFERRLASRSFYLNLTRGYTIRTIEKFFTFVVLFSTIVPISLYVTMEIVRVLQIIFINRDKKMFHRETQTFAKARTSNLNEELGQVEYIFSDKSAIELKDFNKSTSSLYTDNKPLQVDFSIPENLEFFVALALCHSVIPECEESEDGCSTIKFSSSSPDEIALVNAALNLGIKFHTRTPHSIGVNVNGEERVYQLLNTLEFTSDRKRMSVIVKDSITKEIILYCKGADSAIIPFIQNYVKDGTNKIDEENLRKFSCNGLRTLCVSKKVLEQSEYDAWSLLYKKASISIEDRDERLREVSSLIEKDWKLLGVSGIEDKLQDNVASTIATLQQACIKIWMLTGDKQETAINIGISCRLLEGLDILMLNETTTEGLMARIVSFIGQIEEDTKDLRTSGADRKEYALVVDGSTLSLAISKEIEEVFYKLTCLCKSVVCCRVTPFQKSEVVRIVKDRTNSITLAIGDGANDVSMIQKAHIGIGISGKEGRQAVLASDFAISQFRFLERLVLVHGRRNYKRLCLLICYFFFKNLMASLLQLWFNTQNQFSGQTYYDAASILGYNLIFTSLPIIVIEAPTSSSGLTGGMWQASAAGFTALIFVVNLRLVLVVNYIYIPFTNYFYLVFLHLVAQPIYFIALFVTVIIALLPAYSVQFVKRNFFPQPIDIAQEIQRQDKMVLREKLKKIYINQA